MSSAWQDALREAWTELSSYPAESRRFRTRRLSSEIPLDAYAALRAADDALCLALPAEISSDALFEVGGMRLSVVAGERGPLLVLSLEDHDRADLFTTICADALAAAADAGPDDALGYFLTRLDAWRRFLREHRTGMSRDETVGLFGELVVYERLLSVDPRAQESWIAPDDGLHDFMRDGRAIEIKTGLGPSSTIQISSLDQLEPSGLRRLDLLHVRLLEASDGSSIEDLIGSILRHLPDDRARRAFDNALLRRGLMPDDGVARSGPRTRVRAIDGYSVGDRFPRLIRSAVPIGIVDAKYVLEVRAIAPHAVDADAVLDDFLRA